MRDIKSILEGIVSQGKPVGSGGSVFRHTSSSSNKSGLNIGAHRAQSHELETKKAVADSAEKREDEVKKRNREAKQRQKETMQMSKEETVTEAKHVFHVHLHADDTRLGKMVDDNTVEPIGAKPKGTKIKLTVPAHDTRTARDKATRYAAKNFGVHSVKSIEYKGLHEDTVVEANIGPNVDTETIRGIHQRAHASITNPNNKKLTYSHPGFADQIDNELKARKELAKRGIKVERPKHRAVIEHKLDEAIKGWKNAASDIRKQRSAASDAKKTAMLVSLKKDGSESGMHDAKSYHASEEEARKKHETITKLNPTRKIRHNLYVDGKKVDTLGEETNTEKREKIENVARMDGAKPTSEKSTLSKTGQIKTKIVEEKPTMSVPNFGLPKSLIDAVRQIVEKKDEDEKDPKKMTGGKTAVDLDPETDEKQNDDDAAAKGKKKAVKEETKSGTEPKTEKEKKLAALASPKDKITHKDVLVGRGVVKEEEVEDLIENTMSFKDAYKLQDKHRSAAEYARKAGDKKAYNAHMQHSASIEDKLIQSRNGSTIAGKSLAAKSEKIFKEHPYGIKENVEQIDELSPITLAGYIKKASDDRGHLGMDTAAFDKNGRHKRNTDIVTTHPTLKKTMKKWNNRQKGIERAVDKMVDKHFESVENVGFSAEEIERIEAIAAELAEAKPTVTSAPTRGANQDQSGFGTKNSTADYTISDEKKLRKEEVELEESLQDWSSKHEKSGNKITKDNKTGTYHAWSKDNKRIDSYKASHKMKEEVDLEEGRGRPRKNPLPAGQEAEVDDTHKHPMQQLEKIAHSIEGREPHYEHKDGSKTKVGRHLARHMVMTHNSMKTTQEKDDFANKLHANRDSMRSAMSKHF